MRLRLLEEVGAEATGHAAATIAAFSGLVRVADATGIPIDDGLAAASAETRTRLGLERFGGAANSSRVDVDASAFTTVDDLFDNRVRRSPQG